MRGTSSRFFILTVFIFVVVGLLRFAQLGTIPAGVTKDESYYGYDAYSLLHTGRDIWGAELPLFFKSTGEYKLNLTYLIIPAVKVFGLTEMAVRLPSALFGFGTIIILFLTLQHLFHNRIIALIAATIYGLSPWSFGMSRLFYEANVGLFFVALGVYATLTHRLSLASIALALSAYLYNPYRYIGAVFLIIGCLYVRNNLTKMIKPVVIYIAILLPLIIASPPGMGTKRLMQEWLLQKTGYELTVNDMRGKCMTQLQQVVATKVCYVIWNKPMLHLQKVSATVLSALAPELLFTRSTNGYIIPEQYGMHLSFLLPFYIIGLGWLVGCMKHSVEPRLRYYLILCIVVSTGIVSAPGSFELYRYGVSFYLISIVMAGGAVVCHEWLKKQAKTMRLTIVAIVLLLGLFQQVKYLITYRLHDLSLPLLFASDVREIYTYLSTKQEYRYIVDKKFHGPITAAYFWRIDPAYFQKNIVWTDPDPWGFINAYQLGNIYSQTHTIESLLCEKHKDPATPIKAVVIDDPGRYRELASFKTYNYSGTLNLHDVYDIDELYPLVRKHYPADLCRL